MIPQSDWKWFGHPGHFICGQDCRFHRCDCKMPVPEDWLDIDCAAYNTPGAAAEGHLQMCLKWAQEQQP